MAYIYKITNDINDKIYIGKTEFSIEKRFKEHCNDAFKEKSKTRPLYNAMRKYGIEHFHIETIEETDCPEEQEKYWIEYFGSFKYGYNATKGGDGKKYLDYELIYKTYLITKSIKQTAEQCHCDKSSVSQILQTYGISQIEIQKNAKRMFAKPVAKLDKDTLQILATYPSVAEAEKLHGNSGHIKDVCKGKRKTCKGYKWKYL